MEANIGFYDNVTNSQGGFNVKNQNNIPASFLSNATHKHI